MSKSLELKIETIADCLDRMKKKDLCQYVIEKPVYKENKDGSIEILKQDIIFVGALIQ